LTFLLAALLPVLWPAAAVLAEQDAAPIEGLALDSSRAELIRRMQDRLATDPGRANALAERILRSSLAEELSGSLDPVAARRDIRAWIKENPEDAAHLAVGFGRDDAAGTDSFERSLHTRYRRRHELNPNRYGGILGRLDQAARLSKTVEGETELDQEEQLKLIKNLFEGEGGGEGNVAGPEEDGGKGEGGAAAAYAGSGGYDRLHRANLTGYSPEVMALQSAMNRRRPPGAPRLIESGRLDQATLRYPFFGLDYDITRLEEGLARQRAHALARLLGQEAQYSAAALQDPEVRRSLEASGGGRLQDPRFETRREALLKARRSLEDFDSAAGKAKGSKDITPALLKRLSRLRRNAALWITIASLEESLHRLISLQGFLTPLLRDTVSKCPAAPPAREAYLRAGTSLEQGIHAALAKGREARELLLAGSDGSWQRAERLLASVRSAAKSLPGRVDEYAMTARKLASFGPAPVGWRAWVDDAILRFLPGLSYSKKLRTRRSERAAALKAFVHIANTLFP